MYCSVSQPVARVPVVALYGHWGCEFLEISEVDSRKNSLSEDGEALL